MVGSPHDDVTLGEIYRGLVALRSEMQTRFDGLQFVSREVYTVEINQLRDEVKELQDWKRWSVRTVVASFLFPILVVVVVALVGVR